GVTGSFSNTYGLTVKDLIAKFAEEDELEATLQELDEARAIATNALEREAALRIQIDLKADGLVGKYRIKAETLERSLHVANQTNAVLQQKLRDIESDHKQTLELMEAQIKRLYNTVCYLVSKIDEMPETVGVVQSNGCVFVLKLKFGKSTSVDLIHERRKSKPLPIPKKKLSTEQKASIVAESLIEERATSSHTPPASPTDIHKIPNLITNTSMPSITEITPPHTPPNKTPENSVASRNSKPPVSLIELELTHPSQSSSSKSVASLFSNFNTQESDSLSSSVSTSAASLEFPEANKSTPPPPPPPPPPPILASGVIPSTLATASTSGQTAHQSKKKLKFVEWEKINHFRLKETIWQHLEDEDEEHADKEYLSRTEPDADLLFDSQSIITKLSQANVFNCIENTFAQKPSADLTRRQKKKSNMVELLDHRKAYSISIFLASMPKEFEVQKLASYILSLSPMIMQEHVLVNLIKFAPDQDEAEKIEKYAASSDMSKLSLPDQLSFYMLSIPQFKARIQCLMFKVTFWDRIDHLEKNMEYLLSASTSLQQAKKFKKLLQMILTLGNFMNGNTSRGGALGIRIASINKIIDTKGSSSTTLMHILVQTVENSFPEIIGFLEELCYCQEASQGLKIIKLNSETTCIYQELKHFDVLLDTDELTQSLKEFQQEVQPKVDQLKMLHNQAESSFKKAVTFYGEKPEELTPNEFFKIFQTFVSNWQKCSNELLALKQNRERLDAQKRNEAERRNLMKHNTLTTQHDLIMENLFAKLMMSRREYKTKEKLQIMREQPAITLNQLDATEILQSMKSDISLLNLDWCFQNIPKIPIWLDAN
ncbi:Delphilin, partial [Choanephora cucurbitarum]